jgi:hypothetical protein
MDMAIHTTNNEAARKDDQYIVRQFIKGTDVYETVTKQSQTLCYLDPNEHKT